MELVKIVKNEVLTDTMAVSELLEVPHKVLMNTIERILKDIENNGTVKPLKFPQKFIQYVYVNKMNRSYKAYQLNEQAYMMVAMQLKGYEKAYIAQIAIIEAFSLMKESLLNQSNSTWIADRKERKALRIHETDMIKDFVKYATNQGSKNAYYYYSNITKRTNKALEFLVQTKEGGSLRNLDTIEELGYIQMLDIRAKKIIEFGMEENLPYKHIYKLAKEQVNTLADSLNFKKQIINKNYGNQVT